MNENIKNKLANRSTYIVIALLLISVLTVTVLAIATTVANKEPDIPPVVDPGNSDITPDNDKPTNTTPDDTGNNGDEVPPDKPSVQKPIYKAPCSGVIQKGYSEDILVFSATMNDHRIHLGIDIAGKLGDPVYSFSDGTVEKVFSDPFMGKTIIIDHGNGLKSHYMNLADTIADGIEAGKKVNAGTVIGAIGETAIRECADSPHLHFELRMNDKKIDPTTYITIPSVSEKDDVLEG